MLTLGMVMVNCPKLLLYDEPLAGLSEDNIPEMIMMLSKIREKGTTMMIVEHHVKELLVFVNRILGFKLGIVSQLYNDLNSIVNTLV